MRVVAVNHVADVDRLAALPDEWVVWHTTKSAGFTYQDIATHAVLTEWDQSTVLVQDDVRFTDPPAVHDSELVVYGGWANTHVCPRAFAASPETWRILQARLSVRPVRLCPTFSDLARQVTTMLLNQVEHLEAPRTRPWPRRI